jgi:hypothetical protein
MSTTQTRRQDWITSLDELRANGVLTADEENGLVRYYDEQRNQLEEDLAHVAAEYQRRTSTDGAEAANAWLADKARELGRRDGAATRRVVDQLHVVAQNPRP